MSYKRLWIALSLVLVISFAVLGGGGVKVINNAPPVPAQVVTSDANCYLMATSPVTDKTYGNQ